MIHRTRQGGVPSGGPEAGRTIVRMLGDIFVEYSGPVPDQAELDAHLRPPPPDKGARIDAEIAASPALQALLGVLADKPVANAATTLAALVAAMKARP